MEYFVSNPATTTSCSSGGAVSCRFGPQPERGFDSSAQACLLPAVQLPDDVLGVISHHLGIGMAFAKMGMTCKARLNAQLHYIDNLTRHVDSGDVRIFSSFLTVADHPADTALLGTLITRLVAADAECLLRWVLGGARTEGELVYPIGSLTKLTTQIYLEADILRCWAGRLSVEQFFDLFNSLGPLQFLRILLGRSWIRDCDLQDRALRSKTRPYVRRLPLGKLCDAMLSADKWFQLYESTWAGSTPLCSASVDELHWLAKTVCEYLVYTVAIGVFRQTTAVTLMKNFSIYDNYAPDTAYFTLRNGQVEMKRFEECLWLCATGRVDMSVQDFYQDTAKVRKFFKHPQFQYSTPVIDLSDIRKRIQRHLRMVVAKIRWWHRAPTHPFSEIEAIFIKCDGPCALDRACNKLFNVSGASLIQEVLEDHEFWDCLEYFERRDCLAPVYSDIVCRRNTLSVLPPPVVAATQIQQFFENYETLARFAADEKKQFALRYAFGYSRLTSNTCRQILSCIQLGLDRVL